MTTALSILQLIGILFAAGATVASLLKSRGIEEIEVPSPIVGAPTRKLRRLSREARVGAWFVLAGLVVSILAGALSQAIANRRDAQAQQVTALQLTMLSNSVESVQRIISRFDSVKVQAAYEIRMDNKLLSPLACRLRDLTTNVVVPSSPDLSPRYNMVGYASLSNRMSATINDSFVTELSLDADALQSAIQATPTLDSPSMRDFQRFLKTPRLALHLYVAARPPLYGDADMITIGVNPQWSDLRFLTRSNQLIVTWTFEYRGAELHQSRRAKSPQDLSRAHVVLYFIDEPRDLTSSICPIRMSFDVDGTKALSDTFDKIPSTREEFIADAKGHGAFRRITGCEFIPGLTPMMFRKVKTTEVRAPLSDLQLILFATHHLYVTRLPEIKPPTDMPTASTSTKLTNRPAASAANPSSDLRQ